MKQMNEVFELPVDHKKLEMYGAGELQGVPYHVVEEHAAHAINNVDALADELAAIIADHKINGFVDKLTISSAESVLNAYRGAK